MWAGVLFLFVGLGIFAYLKISKTSNDLFIGLGCILIFIALWLDKGLGFVFGGLVVNPLDEIRNNFV